jgi:serine/threonine-protein kinase RsbW
MIPSKNGELVLNLASRLEYLTVVDKVVEGLGEVLELPEEELIAVATSVIEACTNAIQHGHAYDPSKVFSCAFRLEGSSLVVTVRDSGPGFDVDKVLQEDPTGPGGLLRSRGRGIYIMRRMMDRVEFEIGPQGGTTVRLVKRLRRVGGADGAAD